MCICHPTHEEPQGLLGGGGDCQDSPGVLPRFCQAWTHQVLGMSQSGEAEPFLLKMLSQGQALPAEDTAHRGFAAPVLASVLGADVLSADSLRKVGEEVGLHSPLLLSPDSTGEAAPPVPDAVFILSLFTGGEGMV